MLLLHLWGKIFSEKKSKTFCDNAEDMVVTWYENSHQLCFLFRN